MGLSFRNKIWVEPEVVDNLDLYTQIITNRYDRKFDLNASFKNTMPNPMGLPNLDKLIEVMVETKKNSWVLGIFGDYDADGLTSVAMWVEFCAKVGIKTKTYIPNRKDGYGVSKQGLNALEGVDLILFLDCGSNSVELIDGLACPTYILDHHQVITPPKSAVLINPWNCGEEYRNLCTAGLSFLAIAAMRNRFDLAQEDIFALSDLGAIGTLGDIMPLTGFNRALVSKGLKLLNEQTRPNIALLNSELRIAPPIYSHHISFYLIPCLNAPGRVASAQIALDLLVGCDNPHEIARSLVGLNEQRKNMENELFLQAQSMLQVEKKAIILKNDLWHPGIVGIVAGRVRENYGKTSFVFYKDNDLWRGSARGNGVGKLIQESVRMGFAHSGGGHHAAGGIAVPASNFEEWAEWIEKNVDHVVEEIKVDAVASESAIGQLKSLSLLGPFGAGNPSPIALLRNVWLRNVVDHKGHLRLILNSGKSFFAFKAASSWGRGFVNGQSYDLLLSISESGDVKIEDGRLAK